MALMRTVWRACWLAPLWVLGGCISAYSIVPAITEASRTEETPPLRSGRYCLPAGEDEDGAMDIEQGSCVVLLDVGPGTFTLAGEDPENPGPFTVDLAELPRGVHLAQTYVAEEGRYELYLIMMTVDAAMILEVGEQTSEVEALGREAGVTLARRTDMEAAVRPGETPPPPEPVDSSEPTTSGQVYVVAGEPDAVLDFMRRVSDSIFIEARESGPPEDGEFPISVLPLFRVGTSVEDSHLDEAEAMARIEALRPILEQAIARE